MKNELIVKDNALINASYNLELTEQRLVLLSIVKARQTGMGIDVDSKLEIHAQDYAQNFHVTLDQAYKALKNAVLNLFERKFSYETTYSDTDKKKVVKSRWVSDISYVDDMAILEITFAPKVVPLITRLEEHFTSYELIQVSNLTGKYAVRLYELLISWRKTGKMPTITIEQLRHRLGIEPNEYKTMSNFKRVVIDPSILQINKYTDISVKYEQHKKGRVISGFSFIFKEKKSAEINFKKPTNVFTSLTEKQITFFAHKLAHDNNFASQYAEVGEEYSDLEARLIKKLADIAFVQKIHKDLERLGFKP